MVATMVSRLPDWEAEVIDENNFRRSSLLTDDKKPDHDILQRLRPADAVGFYGGLSSTIQRIYELARFYKEKGCLTVGGGQHFVDENIPEALDNGLDFLVLGEGEIAIRELLAALAKGAPVSEVAGIAFKDGERLTITSPRPENNELDLLPLPDFSLLRHSKISLYPVSWVRGCGMKCEFCTVKGKVRCPSPEHVFNQITSIYERTGAVSFFVVDDLFGQNNALALDLCRKLKEYQAALGVRFHITVQIRLDRANNTELLTAMRQANIRYVAIGYESPVDEDLSAMSKKLKAEDMIELTRKFHRAGFLVHGMFIFGYPLKAGEPNSSLTARERVKCYWRFIRKARLDTIQILLPVPLPGTDMTKRLHDEGRVFPKSSVGWEFYDGNFPLFTPDPPLTPDDMFKAAQTLMGRFYSFRHMFYIGWNILCFPMIVFPAFDLNAGWRRWYKSWRNNVWRFTGWTIIKRWSARFDKEAFMSRIKDYAGPSESQSGGHR
jgi:radical SAM superfamily enzyme YgiQ (UPF0313 family)